MYHGKDSAREDKSMTIKKRVFAPEYSRTPEGWIVFPRDVELRRKLFVPESFQHPAKMSLHLLRSIIDLVSEPRDKLLDCMSGTGSIMIATLPLEQARQVYLIEDSPYFHKLQCNNKELFIAKGVPDANITLLQGPCQDYLPLTGFFDHVIFSPPYADTLNHGDAAKDLDSDFMKSMFPTWERESLVDYIGSSKNLGRMTSFFYNQAMAKIYPLLLESLRPGGTMTIVLMDQMRLGKRIGLSDWAMRTCIRAGFELLFWEKREASNTGFKQRHRAKGYDTINDEDVLGFIKPL